MKIAIIDVDLIERKKHRFPNLACKNIKASKREDIQEYINMKF